MIMLTSRETEQKSNFQNAIISKKGGMVLGIFLVGWYYTQIAAHAAVEIEREIHKNDLLVEDSHGQQFNYHPRPPRTTQCFVTDLVTRGYAHAGLFKFSKENAVTQEIVVDNLVNASLQCFATKLANQATFLNELEQKYFNMKLQETFNKNAEGLTEQGKLKLAKMISNSRILTHKGNPQSYKNFKADAGSGFMTVGASFMGSGSLVLYSGHNYTERHLQQGANNLIDGLTKVLPSNMRLSVSKQTAATAPGLIR
jgi:hypothetical protein